MDFSVDLMNDKEVYVNILGSCVLRDAFGLGKDFGNFHINKFIQSNSPFSLHCKPFSEVTGLHLEAEEMKEVAPAWYGWADANFEKTAFSQLKEFGSDYLICSLTEARYPLYRIRHHGEQTYVTIGALNNVKVFCQNGDAVIIVPKFLR